MDVAVIIGLAVCALAGAAVLGLLGIALRNATGHCWSTPSPLTAEGQARGALDA